MYARTVFWILFICVIVLSTKLAYGSKPPCLLSESSDIQKGEKRKDGSVFFEGISYPKKYQFMYNPSEDVSDDFESNIDFFLNTTAALIPDEPHLRGCTCKLRTCVRKCCAIGSGLVDRKCVEDQSIPKFAPNLYYHRNGDLKYLGWKSAKYAIVVGNTCANGSRYILEIHPSDINYLYINGSLLLPNFNGKPTFFDHKSYCIDFARSSNETTWTSNTLLCMHTEEQFQNDLTFKIFPVGLVISIIFLILTFLVYLVLPELHTIHGKVLMHYVGALAVAYSLLAFIQISTKSISDGECVSYGMICYIAFILSFFWLNIMSFDIWWAFSGKGGFRGGVREAERKKFLCYLCYAWFGTLVIFSISAAMQFHTEVPEKYSPGFGIYKCWLQDAAIFPYFYLPMLVLIVINVGLFSATAFKICTIKRDTRVLRQEGSTKHTSNSKVEDDTQRFWLYMKLFLVMGVNWTMEILSWAVGGSKWLWIVTDVFNSVQGLVIFLIFVFKPKIKKLLIKRFLPKHPSKIMNPILMACCPTDKIITTDATSI
uniref:Putative g protein-coupled receptor n=1 Tax=Xenopsylla cheopis TaxID=163159 RepID=A0A6M2E015_XENCH